MIDFPITPTLGQQYTSGDRTWVCIKIAPGAIWDMVPVSTSDADAAAASALAAATSATNAATSEANAATSEDNAADSAADAAASAASIAGGPVASFNTRTGIVTLTKADVTGTGLAKSDIALGNVDNTSDANKPVSTAAQTALDLKADLASPALTGNPTATTQADSDNSTRLSTTAWIRSAMLNIASTAGLAVVGNSPGYIKFPSWLGGIIIQWGSHVATTNASSAISASYALTFPNSVSMGVVSNGDTGATLSHPGISSGGLGLSSMTVVWSSGAAGIGGGISTRTNFIVIGF